MNIVDKLTYLLRAMEATQNAAEIDGEMKARTNIGLDIYRLNGIIQEVANDGDAAHEECTLHSVVGRSEQLCQHGEVTSRICDNCGATITYVPDKDLA